MRPYGFALATVLSVALWALIVIGLIWMVG